MLTSISRIELCLTGIIAIAAIISVGRVIRLGDSTIDSSSIDSTAGFRTMLPREEILTEWYAIGHLMGPESAPIQIIEFANVGCSFCKALHYSIDSLRTRYPDQISVRWLHWVETTPTQRVSNRIAAVALECAADQSRFESFLDDGFEADVPPQDRRLAIETAKRVGVPDLPRFSACMDSGTHEATLQRHLESGRAVGITVTPTWYLNGGAIRGALPTETIDSIIVSILRPDSETR